MFYNVLFSSAGLIATLRVVGNLMLAVRQIVKVIGFGKMPESTIGIMKRFNRVNILATSHG